MEFDSDFHSLLHNLKIDGPWTPPKSWESIAVESGDASSIDVVPGPQDTLYDLSSVSEAVLVRLVINALQGVRSAIVEIDKLSCSFCSSQADRSFHRVPSLWRWLSSTHALGGMLKSISHSGLLFFFLRDFVSYFFYTEHKYNSAKRDKNEKYLIPSNCGQDKSDTKELPPYSLVNQAFAVAIGKLLEGYISSLNTLPTSIKLRRSEQCKGDSIPTNNREVTLTSAIYSEMTVMEVYLHTKELRSQIDALGSICFSRSFYQTLLSDGLNLNSTIEFHNFPRGADLLSYLYVQFRDVDQVHHALLKYLFVHSYKPYSGFIKLWMYRATIDDPYGEFFVASSDTTPTFDSGSCSLDNFFLASIKSGVSIPCFLKDACHPLLLAGQQLQVLVRLLDFCDLSFSGDYVPCDMSLLREILPFWFDSPIKLDFLSNSLIFDSNGIDALNQKREIMYRTMLDKLQNYLVKFSATDQLTLQNVIAYGSMPILLGEGSGMKIPSMFEYESNFIHGNIDEMQALSRTFTSQLCHSSTVSLHYAFSMDHMLVKAPRIPTVCNSRDVINDNASHFPKLNFSSVTDPFNLHSESVPLGSSYRSKTAASMTVNLGGSVARLEDSGGLFKETEEEQPISASLCYSAGETNSQNYYQLPNSFGGAGWTRSLTYPIKNATYSVGDIHLEGKFFVPLDIILDRCILQEILLQYKYISCFTIKFLEEGFNLREHLLALRRYHFLEISDWADLFVMSLSCQSALQHKPARIQELLDLALQRSSCDNDPYKKRLFICTKEQTTAQLAFANDIHAFDHMVLGYRVDWPVNIIVTQGALKIYADIFRYLLQIRVAVTSQTEVWHYLKGLLCFLKHDQHKTFHEMEDLNILMRMRQHINHFASTLQQYVQSQLSNVTWHRFQDSLKHMVNYMLDLESMHKLYLADALRICFLSDDSKEVAIIVKNILQCALDFRWCFSDHLYEKDKSCLRSQINFAQVSILSNIFEKNLKDLYLLYLKWPTHNEFGLSHLWINLNYNGYFTTIINKDLGYSHL